MHKFDGGFTSRSLDGNKSDSSQPSKEEKPDLMRRHFEQASKHNSDRQPLASSSRDRDQPLASSLPPLEKGTPEYDNAVEKFNRRYSKYGFTMDERDNDHNKVFETLKNSIERSYQRAAFTGKNIPDKEKKSLIYMHKMREFIDEKFVLLEKGTLKEGTLEYSDAMLELKNRFMDFFVATDEKIYDFIKARELVRNSIYNLYKIIVPKIRPNKDSTDPEEKRLAYLYDAKRFINKTFNRVES